MAFNFPNINPVIYHIWGGFSITWYSLSYIFGIIFAWLYVNYLNKRYRLNNSPKFIDDLITYSILGIIIGGRLGYVIFYDLNSYIAQPIEIFKTWHGGMSFHGGLTGLVIAIFLACQINKKPFLPILDIISAAAPIGLFLGRIANFINAELYGRVTDVYFAVIFPDAGNLPRHPSQLYEAFLEGICLFSIQYFLIKKKNFLSKPGLLSASFLIQYSFYRFAVEFFREPDAHIGLYLNLSRGQFLSIAYLILGLIIIIYNQKLISK